MFFNSLITYQEVIEYLENNPSKIKVDKYPTCYKNARIKQTVNGTSIDISAPIFYALKGRDYISLEHQTSMPYGDKVVESYILNPYRKIV